MAVFYEDSLYCAEYLNKAVNLRETKQYILFWKEWMRLKNDL